MASLTSSEKRYRYNKKWREQNREKHRRTNQEWYQRNREEILARQHQYYQEHGEEIRRRNRIYGAAHKEQLAETRRERKRHLVQEFGGHCQDCGAEFPENPEVFDFDHRESEEKRNLLSLMKGMSWENIMVEAQKCDLVCSNCHRIRTTRRRNGEGV